jgi:glucose/arabinose dehydrogenase
MRTRLLVALSVVLVGSVSPALGQLRTELFVGGFSQPVAFVQDPSQPTVQVVVQQGGRVRVVQNGVLLAQDYLDLTSQVVSGGEQGLLGLAFAPDYATSGRVYVNFTNLSGDTVIARFLRHSSDPLRADPATRFDLVWPGGQPFIDQPFDNHNGGHLAFGPDGYLYIGLGDGGGGNDPLNNAQNPRSLLGKMLRIDVSVGLSHPKGYVPVDISVPPAVVVDGGAPSPHFEIWAFGLRNPWRYSFDDPARGGTGALIIADVGQNAWEEVNYSPAGGRSRNYGWPNREGLHANLASPPPYSTPLTDPVHEYSHADGQAITGGVVYRGSELGAAYAGRYFFADIVSNRVWSLALSIDGAGEASAAALNEHTAELGAGATAVSSFGVDANGELYLVSYGLGAVYRIVSDATTPPVDACVAPDPFVALGGGTCCNGGWLPPGLACGGAPVTPPPPPPTPPEVCETPDPFLALGGGTCCNGGWLPPGLTCGGAPAPPPPPPPPPPPDTCTTPDPFVVLGGGTCCNGGWLPPGLTCTVAPAPPPPPPDPPSDVACVTPDPFGVLGGGTCCNGGWLPPGLACSAPAPVDTGACNILFMEPEPGGDLITSISTLGGDVVIWTLVDPPLSCEWSARSEVSWITVTSPAYPTFATGDGALSFTVAPNTSVVTRTGRIQVADKFLTVVQTPLLVSPTAATPAR